MGVSQSDLGPNKQTPVVELPETIVFIITAAH